VLTGKVDINFSNEMNLDNSVIPIAKDGTFKYVLDVEKPTFYNLNYEDKKAELFISPGDNINIYFNAKDFYPTLNITGNNADLNMFLKAIGEMKAKTYQYIENNWKTIYALKVNNFTSIIDSIKLSHLTKLDEFLKNKSNVDRWFVKKIRAEITFGDDLLKLIYPRLFKSSTGKLAQVDSNYFENITKDSYNDPDFIQVESYKDFMDNYIDIMAAGKYKYDDYNQLHVNIKGISRYKAITGLKANKEITDFLLDSFFDAYIGNYGIRGLESVFAEFEKDYPNDKLKEKVLQSYNKKIEERKEPSEIRIYKRINDFELEAHIFYPLGFTKEDKRPAFLFFHGGGWSTGMPEWGYYDCKRYSSKGMVSITFEYRLMDIHGVRIVDCVKDAKSALYWVRTHAGELGIDTGKIVVSGFSAGAHLALCTALLNEYEDPGNDPAISCKPNALILGSASYSTEDWFHSNSGTNPESISPFHQLRKNMVPTLMFHGKYDELVSYEKQFLPFIEKMKSLNNKFTYHTFDTMGHFFFRDPKNAEISTKMTDDFLVSLGYIK
jgi:acetyl esterase/lipase